MKNRISRKGSTLIEVLVSFAILATTGIFMVGFLFKNPTTNRAWLNNYGQELSKIILLSTPIEKDTTIEHTDANGILWETVISATQDSIERCFHAVSIRLKKDTTRSLHYCKYEEGKK